MYVNYSSIANLPFVEKGSAPSTRESPEIHKEIQRLQVKKIIRERLIRVARCYPCFIFLTCVHCLRLMDTMLSHWNPFPSLDIVSTAFGVDKSKKKHGYHGLCTDWSSRIFFFDIIFANDSWIYSGSCRIWSTMVLAASRLHLPMISATDNSPLSFSPVGEMLVTLVNGKPMEISQPRLSVPPLRGRLGGG